MQDLNIVPIFYIWLILSSNPMKLSPVFHALFAFLLCSIHASGQNRVSLNIDLPSSPVRSDHLKLGGTNSQGRSVEVNNFYVSLDGKPVIPVTGEFHYSRYPAAYWEESILKMRAGGISMIATYVFWNIHEEKEGEFDWSGSKNLRRFITLCAKHHFDVIVRIGPFCHGEIRNGGLPDWLLGKPLVIRSNDPEYLRHVEILYQQIGQQLEGLYFKDGGPVVGIQLENEYQHSAAPWGLTYPGQPHDWTASERDREFTQIGVGVAEDDNPYAKLGNEHMKVLKQLARRAGIIVPLYTATGWGNAAIIENESLPVTAAYPYPTWAPEVPSEFYLYTKLQEDPDYAPVRYQPLDYPYFAAELGGGIMNTYNRRPLIPPESMDPMINRFLGSGANGIGYYMYHGGSTPRGQQNYYSDVAVGCPIISYDFQAPIGEYGQAKPSFHRLKPIHLFLRSFGELLAPMQVVLPDDQRYLSPEKLDVLRYSVRTKEGAGFIFLNNYQDHLSTRVHENIAFELKSGTGSITIPEESSLTLLPDQHAILPFGMSLGDFHLNYATSQLLTFGSDNQETFYVFFSIPGIAPEFSFARNQEMNISQVTGVEVSGNRDRFLVKCIADRPTEFSVRSKDGHGIRILTIPHKMAMNAYKINITGKDHLIITEALVLHDDHALNLLSREKSCRLHIYPEPEAMPEISAGYITATQTANSVVASYDIEFPLFRVIPSAREIQSNKFAVSLPGEKPSHVNDLILNMEYFGDTGMGFIEGELVADHFYNGTSWEIGLRQFMDLYGDAELVFYFRPIYENAPFLPDLRSAGIHVEDQISKGFELKLIEIIPEYKGVLIFP